MLCITSNLNEKITIGNPEGETGGGGGLSVQTDRADVIRILCAMLMSSFYLGLIGPREVGQGGAKEAIGERVKRECNQSQYPSQN